MGNTSKLKNLIGLKFGRLTVIDRAQNATDGKVQWACQCDCGNPKIKIIRGSDLKLGKVKSCGCLALETRIANGKKNKKHGDTHSRLWTIWCGMKSRCDYIKNIEYHNYGGRGITYCSEWNDYVNFKEWALDHGYQDDLTLERIDCDKDYCPNNCTWATMKQQQNNKRNTIRFTINNENHSVSEWADITGIPAPTLTWRFKHGWSEEEMFMPTDLGNGHIRKQRRINNEHQ